MFKERERPTEREKDSVYVCVYVGTGMTKKRDRLGTDYVPEKMATTLKRNTPSRVTRIKRNVCM